MSSERLLKIGDVAALLGVTTQTLQNWTNSGYMDAIIIVDFELVKLNG